MRETEGERLKADVLSRLLTMEEHLSFVEERSPKRWRNTGPVSPPSSPSS